MLGAPGDGDTVFANGCGLVAVAVGSLILDASALQREELRAAALAG
jgi:hypothetical protein